MKPRRLDWRAIEPKLVTIDELLGELAGLGTFDERRLRAERVHALAVERILTLVVDLAFAINSHVSAARLGRAPESYAESFTLAGSTGMISKELAAALRPSTGTRNVLVHGYVTVDYAQVATAIPLALQQYGEYVRQVAAWLRDVAADETEPR